MGGNVLVEGQIIHANRDQHRTRRGKLRLNAVGRRFKLLTGYFTGAVEIDDTVHQRYPALLNYLPMGFHGYFRAIIIVV